MEFILEAGQEFEIGPSPDDLLTLKLVEVKHGERVTIAISSARKWGIRGCPTWTGPEGGFIKLNDLGDPYYVQVDTLEIIDDRTVKFSVCERSVF